MQSVAFMKTFKWQIFFFLAQDIVYVVLSEVWNEDDDKQGGQIEDYGQIRKVCLVIREGLELIAMNCYDDKDSCKILD